MQQPGPAMSPLQIMRQSALFPVCISTAESVLMDSLVAIASLPKTCCHFPRQSVNVTPTLMDRTSSVSSEKVSPPSRSTTSKQLFACSFNRSSTPHRLSKQSRRRCALPKFRSFSISSRRRIVVSLNRYGLIAGNGKLPFLVLEAARSQGIDMVVAAIKEETFPDIDRYAKTVHWMSLGQLGKLIKTFKSEGVNQAV